MCDLGETNERHEQFMCSMSQTERQRLGRFRRPVDARRFVARRGLRREILARYTGFPPSELRFHDREMQRPALVRNPRTPDIRFSSASSGDLFLLAVACAMDIGVDVERLGAVGDVVACADRICTPAESAWLRSLPVEAWDDALCQLWTRKEALLKALGLGLSRPASTVDVRADRIVIAPPMADHPAPALCIIHSVDVPTGFRAHVAAITTGSEPVVQVYNGP